jgi:hypothetical protein
MCAHTYAHMPAHASTCLACLTCLAYVAYRLSLGPLPGRPLSPQGSVEQQAGIMFAMVGGAYDASAYLHALSWQAYLHESQLRLWGVRATSPSQAVALLRQLRTPRPMAGAALLPRLTPRTALPPQVFGFLGLAYVALSFSVYRLMH